jgi:hypothetical protein
MQMQCGELMMNRNDDSRVERKVLDAVSCVQPPPQPQPPPLPHEPPPAGASLSALPVTGACASGTLLLAATVLACDAVAWCVVMIITRLMSVMHTIIVIPMSAHGWISPLLFMLPPPLCLIPIFLISYFSGCFSFLFS